MNTDNIDVFKQTVNDGCRNVILQICGLQVLHGEITQCSTQYCNADIAVIIGIFGEFRGQVYFTLKMPLALKLASHVIGEPQSTIADELFKSALSELCNIIMGNIVGSLYKIGIELDITPPTVLTSENIWFSGDKLGITSDKMEIYKFTFTIIDDEDMCVCVALPTSLLQRK
ncbi:MAG: chemotaxis protein CheX [Vulcanibacillus sp.]